MKKTYDVVALGELLIDFTVSGISEQGNTIFEANPGGAPCNVLAMLNKLGKTTAFIGKVGNDMFGKSLKQLITDLGIESKGLVMDDDIRTTLAFVQNFENGDRDFSFYRNPGADMMLCKEEIVQELIEETRIFHFGTLSMTHTEVGEATKLAVEVAKEKECLISFDPNLRPPLWSDLEEAKAAIEWGMSQCDILKISDNEVEFITGQKDYVEGAKIIRKKYPNIRLLNVTAGADGSYSFYQDNMVFVPSFLLGGTIDTTGAGDTFCACVLNYVCENGLEDLQENNLEEMLKFANAAAYLVTTRKGAIKSMPERENVVSILGC